MPTRLLCLSVCLVLALLPTAASAQGPGPAWSDPNYSQTRARIEGELAQAPTPELEIGRLIALRMDGDWLDPRVPNWVETAVASCVTAGGPGSTLAARAMLASSELLYMRADYAEAREWAMRAEAGARRDPAVHRWYLTVLGRWSRQMAKYDDAKRQLLAARELLTDPESLDASVIALEIGRLEHARNEIPAATPELQAAVRIREAHLGPDHPFLADALSELGMMHRTMGNYPTMAEHLDRAHGIWSRHLRDGHPSLAIKLQQEAYSAALIKGDIPLGRQLYEAAADAAEASFGPRHPDLAMAWYGLAYTLYFVGEHWRTAELLPQVLALWQEKLGERHPRAADVYKFMAITARSESPPRLADSRVLFEKAIDIWVEAIGEQHSQVAVLLVNVAETCNELGQYEDAARFGQRARDIWVAALGDQHPFVAWVHNIMGHTNTLTGDFDAAEDHYDKACAIFERVLAPYHYELTETLQDFALSLLKAGRDDRCVEIAQRAESNARALLRLNQVAISERELLSYASQRKSMDGVDILISLAAQENPKPNVVAAGLDALIHSRVFALDEVASRHRSLINSDDEITAQMVAELNQLREEISMRVVQGPSGSPDEFQREFRELRDQKERLERDLAERSSEARRQQGQREIGLDAVRSALEGGQALVSITRYRHHSRDPESEPVNWYAAFVLKADQPLAVVPLAAAEEIEAAVDLWLADLRARPTRLGSAQQREQRHREKGHQLRALVWDPIAAHLGDTETVFIVPDGNLHMVNLAALPIGEDRYLVEDDRYLHYLSSERDLVATGDRGATGEGLLALGGVDYDGLPTGEPAPEPTQTSGVSQFRGGFFGERLQREDFNSMVFASLPATSTEVDAVLTLWEAHRQDEAGVVLRALEASEDQFKRHASSRRIIHVATHAFFLGVSESADENPLLLSGLALAGANHRDTAGPGEEDGILTAEEIATLDLSGTEWAVLSACDSGVGNVVFDQGVTGLRRAFETAGVGSLIMSLWPVDDRATMAWMEALYRERLGRGASTVASVRQATREVLEQRRAAGASTHPFYWGAFVATGDWW